MIILQYDPSAGFSPGAARYISRMGHDHKTFATALVSLAVKGYLSLSQKGSTYTARRTEQPIGNDLGPGEKALLISLFKGLKTQTVSFKQKNHAHLLVPR